MFLRPALPEPLHKELKALAEQYPDVISYDEKKGAVRWKADLLFPSGKDELLTSGAALDALKQFAGIVNEKAAGFDVIVVGHTDTDPIKYSAPKFKTNWDLSTWRAIAVMQLLAQQKVAMARMGVMGYGEYRPIADNGTPEGKTKNRRVEIVVLPAAESSSFPGPTAKSGAKLGD